MTAEAKAKTSTVDDAEIAQFTRMADQWWDPRGKFAPLHRLNPTRIAYIRDKITQHFGEGCLVPSAKEANNQASCTKHLALLDIGCGGGLVSEPLARLGANVTGIDAGEKNISVAKQHAAQSSLTIDYRCATAEEMTEQFDVVLALEIIEHVADVDAFVAACAKLVKPGGLLIMSTLNRTAKSYALAIIGAEYVLRWLPVGTHTWNKFLRPSELCRALEKHDVEIVELMGMTMHPLTFQWSMNPKDLDVNYFVVGKKPLSS